jgi:hypothetical protein
MQFGFYASSEEGGIVVSSSSIPPAISKSNGIQYKRRTNKTYENELNKQQVKLIELIMSRKVQTPKLQYNAKQRNTTQRNVKPKQ